jgi:multiple sugar transport system permease protein
MFVLPWLLSLLVFTAYPVIGTFSLSLTDYTVVQPPTWAGFDNYRRLFTDDPDFYTAVKNSAYYAGISVPLRLVLALVLALVLNLGVRGIGVYRVVFYLPALVPPIAATVVFMLMFNVETGPIAAGLSALGLSPPDWLRDPTWSKPALILLSLWPLGIEVLVFLAGLREIPEDVLDAAAVDGAGGWRRLVGITLPLLSPVILFNLVIGVIYSFQVFGQALVVGGTGGEPLQSTLMYMVLIYQNAFRYFAMGYASAQAVVLFVGVALLTLLIFRFSGRWVHYEGGDR